MVSNVTNNSKRWNDSLGKVVCVTHVLDFIVSQSDWTFWACNLVPSLRVDFDFEMADVARTTDICAVIVRRDLCLGWELVEVFFGVTYDACSLATLLLLLWQFRLILTGCCWLFGKPLQSLGYSHCSGGTCIGEERERVNELGYEGVNERRATTESCCEVRSSESEQDSAVGIEF